MILVSVAMDARPTRMLQESDDVKLAAMGESRSGML